MQKRYLCLSQALFLLVNGRGIGARAGLRQFKDKEASRSIILVANGELLSNYKRISLRQKYHH